MSCCLYSKNELAQKNVGLLSRADDVFPAWEVISIGYGFASRAAWLFQVPAYRCFSVQTPYRSFDFVCNSDSDWMKKDDHVFIPGTVLRVLSWCFGFFFWSWGELLPCHPFNAKTANLIVLSLEPTFHHLRCTSLQLPHLRWCGGFCLGDQQVVYPKSRLAYRRRCPFSCQICGNEGLDKSTSCLPG